MRHLAQMPVVLIPIHFDREPVNRLPSCQRSIVLRPFISNDFMTGIPAIPGSEQMPTDVSFWLKIMIYEQYCNNFFFCSSLQVLVKIYQNIKTNVLGISRVLYDLTPKPPGTTEWE